MKFILHSLNYSPELTGIGKYNGEMCTELVNRGIDVTAIIAPPYYPEWNIHPGYSSWYYEHSVEHGVKITRCPLYVPSKVTTLKRLIHLTSFALSSSIALMSKIYTKPDVIFLVQPTLFCAPGALLAAKLTGAKTILHIQDYEIDALFGLGMMGNGIIARLAKKTEKWLMKKFDVISTISYSMMDNARQKGVPDDRIIYFPNWSDTEFVNPNTDGSLLKHEWGFGGSDKIILYAGNMGKKQGLEYVLEAAKHFQSDVNTKFVLVGAGAHVEELQQLSAVMNLSNVYFKPLLPWDRVPEMLALADIHLVVQKKGAADAVLPSKLTNILAAGGHALVQAEEDTELGKMAKRHTGIYQSIEPENPDALIDGIKNMLAKDLTTHNHAARAFAEKFLAKDNIINNFVEEVNSLVSEKYTSRI